MFLQLLFI